ncbi:MAG: alpha/beta hydrolase [Sulfuritalea sp.]|nr:alpha/beta hydrolase [Sulfuritalea sp.]
MSTWIFLRGLTRESRHWGAFPEVFRKTIADAEIVTLDLPGNGGLHRMESPLRVEQMADYCHAEMLSRGLKPPYFVLAMSLGAMVALAWAQRHAEEIAGCVLINTSLRPFSPFHQRLRPRNYPVLLKRALLGGSPGEWEAAILALTSNLAEDRASILDAWIALRRECPVSRRNALRQLWAASRYRAEVAPRSPLLLLASAQDRLVDPRCSRQLASRWETAFGEHPAAGHDIPLDDGPWVARQVRDWLAMTAPSGSG